ncbi:hypothetical protein WA1_01985 [Scytonema hofmannii PCC 7110]|uniref:Uncharacterized protein n=1 Tax=Scytonema hofmannii PCC 7110 TaxID=128403 RepID=A0A139XGY6_9CYAN|nr:hypothetical protein WA1_01985 [Scytonema hofmannii PCC 7110]
MRGFEMARTKSYFSINKLRGFYLRKEEERKSRRKILSNFGLSSSSFLIFGEGKRINNHDYDIETVVTHLQVETLTVADFARVGMQDKSPKFCFPLLKERL